MKRIIFHLTHLGTSRMERRRIILGTSDSAPLAWIFLWIKLRRMFMDNRLAVISIIVNDSEASSEINKLLHDFSSYIVGRMGMPYKKRDVSIICIVMDAPEDVISSLSGKLGMLKRVSIKTTFSKK